MINTIPYNHVFFPLLKGIFNSLQICYEVESGNIIKNRGRLISKLHKEYETKIQKENQRNKKKKNALSLKDYQLKCGKLQEDNPLLIDCFNFFSENYSSGFNKHFYEGLLKTHQEDGRFPRFVKLTIEAYKNAQQISKDTKFKGRTLPSPLFILYYSLISPDDPQTSAYSLATCRSMLFRFVKLHPEVPFLELFKFTNSENSKSRNGYKPFDENDIHNSMSSFRKYAKIFARWPDDRLDSEENSINTLVGNTLALKGIVHLWFRGEKELLSFCKLSEQPSLEEFANKFSDTKLKFRLSFYHTDLPDTGEIINILFGVPVPIRGGDVVFLGGLKKSANSGLVVSLSGEPGVGKTSVTLSLAALFYPFGTRCIYITLEESEKDLKKRLLTLVPDYIKELMFIDGEKPFRKKTFSDTWFDVYEIKDNLTLKGFKQLFQILENEKKQPQVDANSIPAINPLYIVVDNINELVAEYKENNENFSMLEDFVEACRNLGAIVVLISAEEIHKNVKLEYLVDVVARLKHSSTEKAEEKPVRLLQLTKTRHQASRPGSHVYHLTGTSGFRISPQIPSQMDKKEKLRKLNPDQTRITGTLNTLQKVSRNQSGRLTLLESNDMIEVILKKEADRLIALKQERIKTSRQNKTGETESEKRKQLEIIESRINRQERNIKEIMNFSRTNDCLLKLYPNTQILIHGYGSSGKAGFALKLLLTPTEHNKTKIQNDYSDLTNRRKVLIVSFLYTEDYYEILIRNTISPIMAQTYPGLPKSKQYTKTFYPGYLRSEDLINKITRLLDGAILEGEPFTGILLDGLHNVFLQFKELQENHMIWPLLYSILSRYELSVVSTFTNFSLSDRLVDSGNRGRNSQFNQSLPDHVLLQKGQTPFLHGLVKASDYYFQLSEEINEFNERKYLLSVKSSINQTPPRFLLEWDRDNSVFKDIHLPEFVNESLFNGE